VTSSGTIELTDECDRARARPALPARAGWFGLAVLLIAGAVLCLVQTRGTTLSFDEWDWALHNRGFGARDFLATHNGHFSLVPLILYKLLFVTAGLGDYVPYRLAVIGAHLLVVGLVYLYARPRTGPVLALLAAAWILFLGPAWQNFLWPFQVAWLISIAAGIGTLLALERGGARASVAASGLVFVSLASSGLGIAVTAGVGLEVLARRRRSLWIVLVPLVLFALWWIGYQHTSTTAASIRHAPLFAAKMAASTVAALAGLSGSSVPIGSGTLLTYGPWLLVALALLVAWALLWGGRASVRVFALLGVLGVFWVTAGLGRAGLSQPYSSRYLYVGGVFLVLVAVELVRGTRIPLWAAGAVAVAIGAAIVSNLGAFAPAGAFERGEAQATKADLGALDIGRGLVGGGYVPIRFPGLGLTFPVGAYYAMADDIGTPAASPAQLFGLPEGARESADQELLSMHRVTLPTTSVAGRSCASMSGFTLPAAGVTLRGSGPPVAVFARRFADRPSAVGTFRGRGARVLRIGPDRSSVPWRVRVTSPGRVVVCGLVASGAP
jgi:hypothetical protein